MAHVMVTTEDGLVLAERVAVADRFGLRLRGLALRPPPRPGGGLFLPRCNAIHTLGLRYALDVVFLAADDRVVRIVRGVGPNRLVFGGRGAASVLELPAGRLPPASPRPGERLRLA